MDTWQRTLYGSFPRDLGTPNRFSVFTPKHFDRAVTKANQRSNVYASISQLLPEGPVCDKVFFDLDAKAPALDDLTEPEQFAVMRDDRTVAESVLGEVVEDMRALARRSMAEGIPIVGLFSGMGVHVHQLYQPKLNPADELRSIGNKYTSELDLQTVDSTVFEPMRISKIPNSRRMEDGEMTGIWTVPLTASEMADATAQELLEWSAEPRRSDTDLPASFLNHDQRPELTVQEEYLRVTGDRATSQELAEPIEFEGGEDGEWTAVDIVEEFISLPCVRERVLTYNPDHKIRWDFAVLMFNYGFTKHELHDIIRELGWKDYDREKTMQQLDNIWEHNYADMSCATLMAEGYCTRQDAPTACPTYGWSGGNMSY